MKRRDLLKAAPAALVVGAVPAAAAETPIMALFRQWLAHNDWLSSSATDGMPEEEFNDRCAEDTEMMERIVSEPTHDLSDLCLKLLVLTDLGADVMYAGIAGADQLPTEARALIGGAA